MKKVFLLLLLGPSLTVCAQKSWQYKIKGNVGTGHDSSKVVMQFPEDGKLVEDSAMIQNGMFELKGNRSEPIKVFLALTSKSKDANKRAAVEVINLYLEPGVITVTSVNNSFRAAEIKGGPVNKDYTVLSRLIKPQTDQLRQLMKDYAALSDADKKDPAVKASRDSALGKIRAAKNEQLKDYIIKNPRSLVSLDALIEYAGGALDYSTIHPMFEALSANVRKGKAAKTFAGRLEIARKTGIGQIAPDFAQADTSGTMIRLSSFRGKYVLLDFWASWCVPCRAENPHVVKAFQQYKDKGFTVLGVSLDKPDARDRWLKAIADDQLTWTQVSDLKFWNNEAAKLYGIQAIPQNYLIGPDGKVVAQNLRGDALHQQLKALLDK
ncbi:TlpA disulfide reductase family protein [Chitinophaga defluvii]|uniref:TlpA disulfide reductase family protein n=1 Tax=Chitinophaga defluvii TaxID=3163343 RepID=A0ABV2TE89_9BACT